MVMLGETGFPFTIWREKHPTGFISFSGVESALSSLKNFQSCISSGMDTASSVALDLVETQSK